MTNSKKIISLLLSVIMIMSVFSIVPFTANADEAEVAATAETEGDFKYRILSDGTAEITKYTGDGGDVTIPSTLGGYTVTGINGFTFEGCTGLTSITIPDSITEIYGSAFEGCTELSSIKVNEGNTVYDSRDNCNAVIETESNELVAGCKNTIIPDSVTSIGNGAFYGCSGLTSISIPDSVTSIGEYSFSGCTGLPDLTIPDTVTNIGGSAFAGCSNLTSIAVPNSIVKIGYYAFDNTAWYDNQPDGLIYIGKIAYKMKGSCPATVDIKDGTLGIAGEAFRNCEEMTKITIPDSVTNIGDFAFCNCTGLTSVTIGNSVTSIGYAAFRDCSGLTSVTIPDSVTSIDYQAFGYVSYEKVDGFTIYGYEGSEAEKYATDNGFSFIPISDNPALMGDADGNGAVDTVDATIVQRFATKISVPYSNEQLMCADIDGDGYVTVVDATFIQRYDSHVKTPYPIGEAI